MAAYWGRRLQEQQDRLYNKSLEEAQKQLKNYYKEAIKDTTEDMGKLYDALMKEAADGNIKVNDLYRYNRYYELRNKLNQKLMQLGGKEQKITEVGLDQLYNTTSKLVGEELKQPLSSSFTLSQDANKVLESIWCADGKHWSDRIWNNKSKLQNKIEKGLVDCVSRGVPKDELVKMVSNAFSVGFSDADRIVRTELTHIQNQAAADRYKEAGIEKYQFLAAIDERTSDICEELDGNEYYFSEGVVGVNMPPMHCNCRSTIIPIIE